MKRTFTLLLFVAVALSTLAQESMEKVMENRTREMYRTLGLTDKTQWIKFIKENYSQALIDKPMKGKVEESDGTSSSTETKSFDNLEAKAMMFERLHNDFGGSKIVSLTPNGETMKMILENGEGMRGTFQLKFSKVEPYLIEGLGIEVGD